MRSCLLTRVRSARSVQSEVIKPVLAFLLAAVLVLLFTACSSTDSSADPAATTTAAADSSQTSSGNRDSTDTVSTDESDEPAQTSGQSKDPSFDSDDLKVVVDNSSYIMLEDASELIASLGEDFQFSEAESCVFEGMDKTFDFGDVLVYTVPAGDTDLLDGFDIVGSAYTTSAGIGIGSTRDEVLAAYGVPADDSDYMLYNESGDPDNIGEPRLTIVFGSDGNVEMNSYYSGSNAQG